MKTDWEKDLITGKPFNTRKPGTRLIVNVNGKHFDLKDQDTVTVPRAVANVLNDAIIDGKKWVDGKQVEVYKKQSMFIETQEIKIDPMVAKIKAEQTKTSEAKRANA